MMNTVVMLLVSAKEDGAQALDAGGKTRCAWTESNNLWLSRYSHLTRIRTKKT